MKYKQGKRFGLSEEEQSLIYWKCRCLCYLNEKERRELLLLMKEAGGENFEALKEYLCTPKTLTNVSLRHYISESALFEKTKRFYEIMEKK